MHVETYLGICKEMMPLTVSDPTTLCMKYATCVFWHAHTYARAGLMAILPGEPGLASFPFNSPFPYILFNTLVFWHVQIIFYYPLLNYRHFINMLNISQKCNVR